VLKKHRDEVWQVKFAPSGTRFASVGKDNVIFLWTL
jgi:WD40 repeat protein